MLSRFLRPSRRLLPHASLRSSFPVPDPPLNMEYKTKRPLSQYQPGMWYSDAAQPEFILTFQEPYIKQTGVSSAWQGLLSFSVPLAVYLGCGVFIMLFLTTYNPEHRMNLDVGWDKGDVVVMMDKIIKDPEVELDVAGNSTKVAGVLQRKEKENWVFEHARNAYDERRKVNAELRAFLNKFKGEAIKEKFGGEAAAVSASH